MNLGIVLASTKQYEESESAYKNALKYRKNYPDCYYNMGNLVGIIVEHKIFVLEFVFLYKFNKNLCQTCAWIIYIG